MPLEVLEQVLALAAKQGIYVFCDGVYRERKIIRQPACQQHAIFTIEP